MEDRSLHGIAVVFKRSSQPQTTLIVLTSYVLCIHSTLATTCPFRPASAPGKSALRRGREWIMPSQRRTSGTNGASPSLAVGHKAVHVRDEEAMQVGTRTTYPRRRPPRRRPSSPAVYPCRSNRLPTSHPFTPGVPIRQLVIPAPGQCRRLIVRTVLTSSLPRTDRSRPRTPHHLSIPPCRAAATATGILRIRLHGLMRRGRGRGRRRTVWAHGSIIRHP